MPTPTVKLYPNEHVIHLVQTDHGVRNINMSYGENDFRVNKGVTTAQEFVVRDNDRKPIDVTGKNLTIIVMDHDNKNLMIEKPLTVLNAVRGKVKVDFLPSEVVSWDHGYYNYSVMIENEDGTKNLLFVDQNSNATGWFELAEDALPLNVFADDTGPLESWTPHQDGGYPNARTRFRSTAIAGDAHHNFNDGLHTVAFYLDNYTGKVWIQGTLEQNPPTVEEDWFDINITPNQFELNYTDFTGLDPFNFRANVTWVRILTEPDDNLNQGTINKVLVKV